MKKYLLKSNQKIKHCYKQLIFLNCCDIIKLKFTFSNKEFKGSELYIV